MIRGVNTLVTGMQAAMARQEVLAKNLANYLTPAFKQEVASAEGRLMAVRRAPEGAGSLNSAARGLAGLGDLAGSVAFDRIWVDFSQGALAQTDRALDVALSGDGFIRVRTGDGDYFSRGGALQKDAMGQLVTEEGYNILGPDGEIVLGEGDIAIGEDGTLFLDGEARGRIDVVEFQPGTILAKVGEGLYAPDDPAGPAPAPAIDTVVKAGYLENSNVDEAKTMTEMVWLLRAYQSSQRMLQAQDDLLGKAINEVGRI